MKAIFSLWMLFGSTSGLPVAAAESGDGTVGPFAVTFLERHCVECHGEFTREAGLRLDELDWNASDPKRLRTWVNVHDRVARGEMPPDGALAPDEADKRKFLGELSKRLLAADRRRQQTEGRTPLRRLNRLEYENTLRELLALPMLDVRQILPPDDRAHGFDNVASAQEFSYVQMSRYLEAAEAALDRAMFLREKPETRTQRMLFREQGRFTKKGEERGETRLVDEFLVFLRQPNSAQAPWRFGSHKPYVAGRYKIRIRGRGATYDHGELTPPEENQVASIYTREKRWLGTVDLPSEAAVREFETWLYTDDELEFFCATLDDRNSPGNPRDVRPYKGPAIAVEYVEVEGPIYERWPRESYRRLFGDLPVKPWTEESGLRKPAMLTPVTGRSPKRPHLIRGDYKGPPLMVVSEQPARDAERLLRRFMRLAYRGPVDEAEFERCYAFARERIELDQYFTGVRELERRLHKTQQWEKKPKPKVDIEPPEDHNDPGALVENTRAMYALAKLAIETDSSRLITIYIHQNAAKPNIPGITEGTHPLTHHGNQPEKLDQLRKIEEAQFRELATLLGSLNETPEEGGSLLDRTMVLYGTCMGNANSHDNTNLPVLLAGGGFKHGQHLGFDRERNYPLPNLYVSMLQRLGIETDRFASSTGTMRGLEMTS